MEPPAARTSGQDEDSQQPGPGSPADRDEAGHDSAATDQPAQPDASDRARVTADESPEQTSPSQPQSWAPPVGAPVEVPAVAESAAEAPTAAPDATAAPVAAAGVAEAADLTATYNGTDQAVADNAVADGSPVAAPAAPVPVVEPPAADVSTADAYGEPAVEDSTAGPQVDQADQYAGVPSEPGPAAAESFVQEPEADQSSAPSADHREAAEVADYTAPVRTEPYENVAVAEPAPVAEQESAAEAVDAAVPAVPLQFAEPEAPASVPVLDPLMGLPKAEHPMRADSPEVEALPEPIAQVPGLGRATTEEQIGEDDFSLVEVLITMLERGASDVHLTSGAHPTIRLAGSLVPLDDFPVLKPESLRRVLYAAITQSQRERFEADLELDFAFAVPGHARFRVNYYRQRDSIGAAFRLIPYEIKNLESLGIPPVVANFAGLPRGFVLVTGPTGSGKSTTLAAVVDLANRTRSDHIMTVEDPIEFLHKHKNCLVNQREVGEDTWSFGNALKHVLRQDPDIILVGEMRDLETIQVALTAAETGHLVFATLHTQDAAQTIDRIIDVFPPHQQQQVRSQLAMSLQGVVCQTLAKTADGRGRAVATEVLVVTPAIRNLIREGKTHQIYSVMQAGAAHGMHTLDQHLAELVRTRRISYEVGLEKCHHLEDFNRLCGRA
jgi:twitching motility protein PilT